MTPEPLRVSLQLLRSVTKLALDQLESETGPQIVLNYDFFWSIPPGGRYDAYETPSDFTVGQLSECVSNIDEIGKGSRPAANYALVWIGQILQAIGEQSSD